MFIAVNNLPLYNRLILLFKQNNIIKLRDVYFHFKDFIEKLKAFCLEKQGEILNDIQEFFICKIDDVYRDEFEKICKDFDDLCQKYLIIVSGKTQEDAVRKMGRLLLLARSGIFFNEKTIKKAEKDVEKELKGLKPFHPNIFDPEYPDADDRTQMVPVKNKYKPEPTYLRQNPLEARQLSANYQQFIANNRKFLQNLIQELQNFNFESFLLEPATTSRPEKDASYNLNDNVTARLESLFQPSSTSSVKSGAAAAALQDSLSREINQLLSTIPKTHKLYQILSQVQQGLPQIIQLRSQNPQQFQQYMDQIQQVLRYAHHVSKPASDKPVQKVEDEYFLNLLKRSKKKHKRGHYISPGGRKVLHLPAGSRFKRRVKVKDYKTGRESWRQMITGIVRGFDRKPVSVKAYNYWAAKRAALREK